MARKKKCDDYDYDDDDGYGGCYEQTLREMRHNPCLMRPLTAVMLLIMCGFWLFAVVLKFPALVLGFLLRPVLCRFPFVIEFLYPLGLGKWIHLFLMRSVLRSRLHGGGKPNDMNRGFHSRTLECRVEVVKGRVFIHPLPQLLDNIGYLVVCCPQEAQIPDIGTNATESFETPMGKVSVTTSEEEAPVVAFVVDCGDAASVIQQLEYISDLHYKGRPIQIQSIFSTHKHHDHTAGNAGLLKDGKIGKSIKHVVGGAVENVPCCNFYAADGQLLPLPGYGAGNSMDQLVEVEAVATPAHTRGSITYVLRPKDPAANTSSGLAFMFTGDTMFCAGGGVPFEADTDNGQEEKASTMMPSSYIKASAANHAVERCFAEILARSARYTDNDYDLTSTAAVNRSISDRLLVFPGHEYTTELLTRQLTQDGGESCKWKHFSPAAFFATVSQLYVAIHRRTLPHSSGKLLTVPSPMSRELLINPYMRNLKKRGEIVVNAIKLWHKHFAKEKVPPAATTTTTATTTANSAAMTTNGNASSSSFRNRTAAGAPPVCGRTSGGMQMGPKKSAATSSSWNTDANDINRAVFTTVYASHLDAVIDDLQNSRIDPQRAAQRLREMKTMLDAPSVGRRPVPGTLPSDHTIYRGLLGMALLGSRPTALTLRDGRRMKLPPPVVGTSDRIRVSRRRLVTVLRRLGLLTAENDGARITGMIRLLWKEAHEYDARVGDTNTTATSEQPSKQQQQQENGHNNGYGTTTTTTDVETSDNDDLGDEIKLGTLKWVVYGIPGKQPSWFSRYCMPCSSSSSPAAINAQQAIGEHPAHGSKMEQHPGELVRHDIFLCPVCCSAAGSPLATPPPNPPPEMENNNNNATNNASVGVGGAGAGAASSSASSSERRRQQDLVGQYDSTPSDEGGGGGGGETFIELTTESLSHILQEA